MQRESRKMAKRRSKNKKGKISIDVQVVTLIIISVLFTILIFTNSGYIGKELNPILGGLVGFIKYIIPIGTLIIAIKIACNGKQYAKLRLIQFLIFIICIAVISTILQVSNNNLNIDSEFEEVIKNAYELGTVNKGRRCYWRSFCSSTYKINRNACNSSINLMYSNSFSNFHAWYETNSNDCNFLQ